jgi:hypothetical protein
VNIAVLLDEWKSGGQISAAQHEALTALVRKDRFSVFVELNALLYLGVLAAVAGLGLTITTYSARLGDAAVISFLTALFAWSLRYTFDRALPYSHGQVEHPGFAFDYVLYLGCLVFALDLGYLQTRFEAFQFGWDHSLLVGSIVFVLLAYRFDNRLVLSLALSSLAAWCGVRLSRLGFLSGGALRASALAYGGSVAAAGAALHRAGIKKHFLDTYLHVAANVLFVALLSGVGGGAWPAFLLALLALAACAVVAGVRLRRFSFVAYGVIYGYLGISVRAVDVAIRDARSVEVLLAYFVLSAMVVIGVLVALARSLGREE